MGYRVEITDPAEAEILDAAAYIANYSSVAADRWLAGVSRCIRSLAWQPRRCALAPESHEFGIEIRQIMYGKRPNVHRIMFRIVEPDIVEVVAVRHGARDMLRPKP